MCMSCDSKEQHSHVNKKRLSLLLGVTGVIIAVVVGAVVLSPELMAVIPFLAIVAVCPAMCTVGGLVSWVRGGGVKRGTVNPITESGTEQKIPARAPQSEQAG